MTGSCGRVVVVAMALAGLLSVPATRAHAKAEAASDDASIRPFRARIPGAAIVDLRKRIGGTRWPDKETVADPSQGPQLAQPTPRST